MEISRWARWHFLRDTAPLFLSACMMVIFASPATVQAGCCWSAVDHKVPYDQSGIWNPNVYRTMIGVLGVADLGGALWEGAETRFGKTLWQTMDSQIIAVGTATLMKEAFTRVRPSDTDDPCEWFAGGHNRSFPSREAAWSASLVTPFVLEYGSQHPPAYGLLLVPLYVGVARVKAQAHWQSDVLFGWAVGGLSGWLAHSLETPLLVHVAPQGVVIGLKTRF